MLLDRAKGNEIAVEITKKYQKLKYKDLTFPVPYFINIAEQEYKKAMKLAGIPDEDMRKAITLVKDGKTFLGSTGGKGSPEEIGKDLIRLMEGLETLGYKPRSVKHIRRWMTEMHVGLACAGYVYNVIRAIELDQNVELLKLMAWVNPDAMKPSHAGAFIFDSPQLNEITDYSDLKPLDIVVRRDHTHVGILLDYENVLSLADCAMVLNGLRVRRVTVSGKDVTVEDSPGWNRHIASGEVIFRRLFS
jgi:hypothetical protein